MEFEIDNFYYIGLSKFKISDLKDIQIQELFSDGRVCSYVIEKIIENKFSNLRKTNGNCNFDFLDTKNNLKFEMRGMSKLSKSINLIPSNMIGAKRKYDLKEYLEKLQNINGFIIVINSYNYNDLFMFFIKSETIINSGNPKKSINKKYISDFLKCDLDYINDKLKKSSENDTILSFPIQDFKRLL